jgi:hypothetical protein
VRALLLLVIFFNKCAIETFNADEPPSCIHEPSADSLSQPADPLPQPADSPPQPADSLPQPADSLPQLTLDATLVPPLLPATSPEPLWLPYIRARLDKLLSVLVVSAFQLLWRPRNGTSVIKPADLISHQQLRDDQRHKLHIFRRLVAILFQEYMLLCISPAGSHESAARDGALISQGRR